MFISKLSIKEYWDEDDERCMQELAAKGHIVGFHNKPFPNLQFYGHQSFANYRSLCYGYRKHSELLKLPADAATFKPPLRNSKEIAEATIYQDAIDRTICNYYID